MREAFARANLVEAERTTLSGKRRLIAVECERAQGLPEHFTASIVGKYSNPEQSELSRQNIVANVWNKFAGYFVLRGILYGIIAENEIDEADEGEADFSPAHTLPRSSFLSAAIN